MRVVSNVLLLALGLLLAGSAGQPAQAVTIIEAMIDAGDLPVTAQSSEGVAPFGTPLDAIVGSIVSNIDQDMYKIYIDDPAGFSASTDNNGTDLDTLLFLFDEDGFGLLAVDDGGANGTSVIPAGSFTGPAGVYHVAVSIYFDDFNSPTSFDGVDLLEIFDSFDLDGADDPIGPNGLGASLPIASWDIDADYTIGSYRIDLTGATVVPEPSTVLLLGAALVPLAALRRRRGAP